MVYICEEVSDSGTPREVRGSLKTGGFEFYFGESRMLWAALNFFGQANFIFLIGNEPTYIVPFAWN